MKIIYHLKEMIYNLYYYSFSCLITSILIYIYKHIIVLYLIEMLNIKKISFLYLTEAFWTYIYISMGSSFLLNFPLFCFFLFLYYRPALYKYQENKLKFITVGLMGYNILIIFWIIIPLAIPFIFNFFQNFKTENITYLPTFFNIYSMGFQLLFIFIFSFNLPIVFTFFEHKYIQQRSKYLLGLLILIALLTPPDIYSLIFIMIPVIFLIEVFLFIKIIGSV